METNYISAPQADALIFQSQNQPNALDCKTKGLMLKLFQKLQSVAACGDDERRKLWIVAGRGCVGDFGDYEEYLTEGDVESREEFESLWLSEYPEPQKWYKLNTIIYKDTYSVFLDGRLTLQITPEPPNEPLDQSELVMWLLSAVDGCVNALSDGSYNTLLRDNLPYGKRVGRILREDYRRIFPHEKDAHLKDISQDAIKRFSQLMQAQPPDAPISRLDKMTSGLFFDCCRLGYEANHYKDIENSPPREMYRIHADGRELSAMLTGRDYIGIVPEDVIPRCCGHLFPGENMIDFMNLLYENAYFIVQAADWYPPDGIRLGK